MSTCVIKFHKEEIVSDTKEFLTKSKRKSNYSFIYFDDKKLHEDKKKWFSFISEC